MNFVGLCCRNYHYWLHNNPDEGSSQLTVVCTHVKYENVKCKVLEKRLAALRVIYGQAVRKSISRVVPLVLLPCLGTLADDNQQM